MLFRSLADCGTAHSFLQCSDDVKREYFAGFLRESTRRKEAEEHNEVLREEAIAAQARIAELRDALDESIGCIDGYYRTALQNAFDISERPDNLDALKQFRDRVIDECAEVAFSHEPDRAELLSLKEKPL